MGLFSTVFRRTTGDLIEPISPVQQAKFNCLTYSFWISQQKRVPTNYLIIFLNSIRKGFVFRTVLAFLGYTIDIFLSHFIKVSRKQL
jgi:hypothetical protein